MQVIVTDNAMRPYLHAGDEIELTTTHLHCLNPIYADRTEALGSM